MHKRKDQKHQQRNESPHALTARFEYDRADEKRKLQEEIEDSLEEREEKGHSAES